MRKIKTKFCPITQQNVIGNGESGKEKSTSAKGKIEIIL